MENEIAATEEIKVHTMGLPTITDDIFDSQFIYWQSIQNHMRIGGFDAVRNRYPGISQRLAEKIEKADYRSLKCLCRGITNTLNPAVPESTLIAILKNDPDKLTIMALQALNSLN